MSGPVKPSAASRPAKTAWLTALAAAAPFHIESSPALVCRIGAWGTTVIATALPVCVSSSPSRLPAPHAAPMHVYITWSQRWARMLAESHSETPTS